MANTELESNVQTELLTQALDSFQDEFSQFNDQSAFLCAALASVLADEGYHNARVLRGAEHWVFWMRRQMNHLEMELRRLNPSTVYDAPE